MSAEPAQAETEAPARLLAGARKILNGEHPVPARQRARVAAVLARCALEKHVDQYLSALPSVHSLRGQRMNFRVQLICFGALTTRPGGTDAAWVWWTLSNLCHRHAYELAPTHAEVAHLIDRVQAVIDG